MTMKAIDTETQSSIAEDVRKQLIWQADPAYRKFHSSLVPGIGTMLGVRVPHLRKIAKETARKDYRGFADAADPTVYEELMIRGMMIGYRHGSTEAYQMELDEFVPLINNWAICDCCCSTYHFMRSNQEKWYAYLDKWMQSEREYEVRFAVVCLLDYFINDTYIDKILSVLPFILQEGYYVKMAVAWAVSVCYVNYPERTKKLLEENRLDHFTQNKAIQKIRESNRISVEEKKRVLMWKWKETNGS
ncbi:MAG: DNA alkylation repair protein [Fusicatenibacter sp.]